MANLVECRNLRLGYGSNALPPCLGFTVGAGNRLVIAGTPVGSTVVRGTPSRFLSCH